MDGYSILKLRNLAPEPAPIFFLRFRVQGIVENPRAPFLFQIGAFAQNLLLEVFGKLVAGHLRNDTASIHADQCCRLTPAITGNSVAAVRVDFSLYRVLSDLCKYVIYDI